MHKLAAMWSSLEEFDAWIASMENVDYPDFLQSQLPLNSQELHVAARTNMSFAFGNPISLMVEDRQYAQFLTDYVDEALTPLVTRWAAPVLIYAQAFTDKTCGHVLRFFFHEAEKVKTVILPDPDTAEVIFGDRRRKWNLFLAVTAVLVLIMKKDKSFARALGFSKSFWGKWKYNQP